MRTKFFIQQKPICFVFFFNSNSLSLRCKIEEGCQCLIVLPFCDGLKVTKFNNFQEALWDVMLIF